MHAAMISFQSKFDLELHSRNIIECKNVSLYAKLYLTVILRTRVEYELIADEARNAELAIAHIRRE